MLAELAACNAAFGVIRTAISNGKEIADAASSCGVICRRKRRPPAQGPEKRRRL